MKNVLCALLISSVCTTGGWSMDPGVGEPPQEEAAAAAAGGARAEQPQSLEETIEYLKTRKSLVQEALYSLSLVEARFLPEKDKIRERLQLIGQKIDALQGIDSKS